MDNDKKQDEKTSVGHSACGKGQGVPDAIGVSCLGLRSNSYRYPVWSWPGLAVLEKEEQASAYMNYEKEQKPNSENIQNKDMAMELFGIALKSCPAQVQGGNTCNMTEEKKQQQKTAYGHDPFFTNGGGKKPDKPHRYLSCMKDGIMMKIFMKDKLKSEKKVDFFYRYRIFSNILKCFVWLT
jgi:hypothetical protein